MDTRGEKGGQLPSASEYLREVLPPDQLALEGLDRATAPRRVLEKTLVIECSDGRMRQVTFFATSRIVTRSTIIDPEAPELDSMRAGPFV